MARARNIKPSFFMNEDLIELPFEARLLFIGLWTLADREGRLENRPKKIKMSLFPADEINVSEQLSNISKYDFIELYNVDGIEVIQITNFTKHQVPHGLEKDSLLPDRNGFYTVYDRVKKVAKGKPRLLTHAQLIAEQNNESPQNVGNIGIEDNNKYETDYSETNNSYETVSIGDQNALNPESLNLNPDSLNHKNPPHGASVDTREKILVETFEPNLDDVNVRLKTSGHKEIDVTQMLKELARFKDEYSKNSIAYPENWYLGRFSSWIMTNYSSRQPSNKSSKNNQPKHNHQPSRNVNDAWPDIPQHAPAIDNTELPEDFV